MPAVRARAAGWCLLFVADVWTTGAIVKAVIDEWDHGSEVFWVAICLLTLFCALSTTVLWRAGKRWRRTHRLDETRPQR